MTQITPEIQAAPQKPKRGGTITVPTAAAMAGVSMQCVHNWMEARLFDFSVQKRPGGKRGRYWVYRDSYVEFLIFSERPFAALSGTMKSPSQIAARLANAVLMGISVVDGKVRAYHADECVAAVRLASQFNMRIKELLQGEGQEVADDG
jgi:hypothetical protein